MCGPSPLRVYTALQLHSHFQNAIPDCTCTSRLALAIYYIKIQTTINVHYTRNIYVTSKDIVIHCHLARFLYVHINVHVHVLTLTSDIFFSLWSVCRYRVLSLAVRRGSSQVAKGEISSNWLNSSSSLYFAPQWSFSCQEGQYVASSSLYQAHKTLAAHLLPKQRVLFCTQYCEDQRSQTHSCHMSLPVTLEPINIWIGQPWIPGSWAPISPLFDHSMGPFAYCYHKHQCG